MIRRAVKDYPRITAVASIFSIILAIVLIFQVIPFPLAWAENVRQIKVEIKSMFTVVLEDQEQRIEYQLISINNKIDKFKAINEQVPAEQIQLKSILETRKSKVTAELSKYRK